MPADTEDAEQPGTAQTMTDQTDMATASAKAPRQKTVRGTGDSVIGDQHRESNINNGKARGGWSYG